MVAYCDGIVAITGVDHRKLRPAGAVKKRQKCLAGLAPSPPCRLVTMRLCSCLTTAVLIYVYSYPLSDDTTTSPCLEPFKRATAVAPLSLSMTDFQLNPLFHGS